MKRETLRAGWRTGWPIGALMYAWMVVYPMMRDRSYDPTLLAIQLLWWAFGALVCGLWINWLVARKKRR